VCSEQITFVISGNSPGLVSNTVFSYLDSDLPLTFWWQGPFSDRWEPHLYAHIDRLVIDSGEWAEPLPQLQRLEKAWSCAKGGFSVNDLTWTRVLHLRLALAAAFDQPAAAGILPTLTEIAIGYGAGHSLAARMMAAWIMDQAGWTLESGDSAKETFTILANGRQIALSFTQTADPRAVSSVVLSGSGGKVTLTHETGSEYIHAGITSAASPSTSSEVLTPCSSETRAELVTERLRRGCNTPRYFRILRTVRRLLGEEK
jgi:glucose-6-phosphate dehydrogenase assembly protein OpcA